MKQEVSKKEEYKKKEYVLVLERLVEIDPRLAALVSNTIREIRRWKSKYNEVLDENRRLISENLDLMEKLKIKEGEVEMLRARLEELSKQYLELEKSYLIAKGEVDIERARKGIAELYAQELLKALEKILEHIEYIYSKPAFELGYERVRAMLKDIREELLLLSEKIKTVPTETKTITETKEVKEE